VVSSRMAPGNVVEPGNALQISGYQSSAANWAYFCGIGYGMFRAYQSPELPEWISHVHADTNFMVPVSLALLNRPGRTTMNIALISHKNPKLPLLHGIGIAIRTTPLVGILKHRLHDKFIRLSRQAVEWVCHLHCVGTLNCGQKYVRFSFGWINPCRCYSTLILFPRSAESELA